MFLYHLGLQLGTEFPPGALARRGYLGVDGFFVLSGLVLALAHPTLRLDAPSVRRFWLRRLLRIYPVHLAMIALLLLLLGVSAVFGLTPRDPGRFGAGALAMHLALLHGWGFGGRWAWDYPSWSISTEWAGYLAFPLLWRAVRAAPAAILAALPALCLAALSTLDAARGGLNLTLIDTLPRFFPEFVAGMAAIPLVERVQRRVDGRVLAVAGGAGLLAPLPDALLVGCAWVALAGLLLAARQGRPPLLARIRGLAFAGVLSFAFYMSFAPVETAQSVLWRLLVITPAAHPIVYATTSCALTLALALAAHGWVERPVSRLAAAWLSRPQGAAPLAGRRAGV